MYNVIYGQQERRLTDLTIQAISAAIYLPTYASIKRSIINMIFGIYKEYLLDELFN